MCARELTNDKKQKTCQKNHCAIFDPQFFIKSDLITYQTFEKIRTTFYAMNVTMTVRIRSKQWSCFIFETIKVKVE